MIGLFFDTCICEAALSQSDICSFFPELWVKITPFGLKHPKTCHHEHGLRCPKLSLKTCFGGIVRRVSWKKANGFTLTDVSQIVAHWLSSLLPLGVKQNHFCSSSWLIRSKVAENIENSRHSSEPMIVATVCNRLRNQLLIPNGLKLNLEDTQSSLLMTCLNQYRFLYMRPCWHWSNCSSLIKVFGYDQWKTYSCTEPVCSSPLWSVLLVRLSQHMYVCLCGCVNIHMCPVLKLYFMSFIRQWEVTVKVTGFELIVSLNVLWERLSSQAYHLPDSFNETDHGNPSNQRQLEPMSSGYFFISLRQSPADTTWLCLRLIFSHASV